MARHAAADLDKEGISAAIIDLRALVPLDTQAVLNSAEKIGRPLEQAVIPHMADIERVCRELMSAPAPRTRR